ncbi:MAG: hypothetical protein JRD93_05050 [Deltaproteobacteria bacterium]|nr:hypothetical protein [Deltaproteobacteria bacterium]MBW2661351.1 hypothetical protein [Deltaproteobacteria bacterium]
MTISTYHIDNILKVYNKQSKMENRIQLKPKNLNKTADIVTLSSEENKKEAFDKISYNLLDIILQNEETK